MTLPDREGLRGMIVEGLAEPESHAFDLFVVHAAGDADFVRGYLVPALNLPSARVRLMDALPLGAVMVSEIDRGVARSRFTIVVLSPAYLADRWAELGEQLASHVSARDVRVIPLHLLDCELPLRLDARVSLDFRDPARWEAEAARLRDLLHTAEPAAEPIACPYPGMRPFTASDASRFFGRAPEINDLIGRLDRGEREIYVIGPSGSGKSSLVQAGLLHVLAAGSSRLERSFVVRTMRPGERPADRLAKLLEGELGTPIATSAAMLDALVARHPPAERVLVVVDQLEELFTLASAAERQRFITMLRVLRSVPQCYLLLGLRADFYGSLMDSALWPEVGRIARLDIAPLRGAALAQAISAPALRVGVHLEARLCDRLVADAAEEPGALPLMQETLRLLWDKRRQRLLGLAAYEALGNGGRGLDVAIARRADTTMGSLTAPQQTIAHRVFLRLVSLGEGRADTRRQQEVQALRSVADDDAELSRVLQRLVDNRLLTLDSAEADHDALADLSHEALITAWPALRTWIDRKRADEQRRRRLEAKVAEWIERGRGAASLLDPVELSEAVQWMQSDAAHELGYGAELPALVAASQHEIEQTERQRRRRTLRAFVVLAVFSVVASILGIVAWRQRHKAQEKGAEAQQKGLEAQQKGAVAEQQSHEARRLLGMTYMEQGRALLLDGHPMQALPYLVAARTEAMDSPVLRMLFAQASRNVPLVTLVGHTSAVRTAALSPDGTRVVTASADKTARVWDVTTGKPVTPPLEHQDSVWAAAFSPDGTRVVTASDDKTARVWDATTGKPVTPPLEHYGSVRTAAFSPDGTRVVTASGDRTARVWDATTGKAVTPPFEHQSIVWAAAFSPDGTRIVTASFDKTARVWDATTGKPVTAPLEHQGIVDAAAFSPDGTRVVTASDDKTARVWDATTGKPVTAPLEHNGKVRTAAFSPDGTRVVTASWDKTARVWDATTGKPVTPPLEHQDYVSAASFSPDGTRLVTASNTARVWDATTGKPVTPPLEHQGVVNAAAFSPDATLVVTASWDRIARVWDATTGKPVTAPLVHQGHVWAAAFSPDRTRVVTANSDKTARVWNVMTGKAVTPPLKDRDAVYAAVFSTDGTRVVTASWDSTARVWDATTGKPATAPLVHHGSVWAAAFSPDGTRVVTASDDHTARVWDATTGNPVTAPLVHQDSVWAAAFSPDGTRVVTASDDKTARVWDTTTGKPVTPPLEHRDAVWAAAFSPNGTQVVTASGDRTARVWDATTGNPVTPPLEHQTFINAVAFSPDGTRVVTASGDQTARVWDATTGKPLTPPLEHHGSVTAAAFSPDGTRVLTASDDKTARVWDATTGKPVTAPLEHQGAVIAAAFSPDGTRVVTASDDKTARVWDLSMDMGSLDDWRLLLRCTPFSLSNAVLIANPAPLSVCTTIARSPAQR